MKKTLFILLLFAQHVVTAQNYHDSLVYYYQYGNYDKALYYSKITLAQYKQQYGEHGANYAVALNDVALVYDATRNYKQAEDLYTQALSIDKETIGTNHPNYASTLNNLAQVYAKTNDAATAEALYKQALAIRKSLYGDNNANYAASLNDLADLYSSNSRFTEAESLYKQVLIIYKATLGEDNPQYLIALGNLGFLYYTIADYTKAEVLYKEVLELEKKSGKEFFRHDVILNNLGNLYESIGNYADAESLYKQALVNFKMHHDEESDGYLSTLSNLAELYAAENKYALAEQLYKQTIILKAKTLGEKNADYALSLNNLAQLYAETGNNDAAEKLFLQTLSIYKETIGEQHPNYAAVLNNLSGLYVSTGRYSLAEPLYYRALAITKQTMGEGSLEYANALSGLANYYELLGNYKAAEPLLKQVIIIRKQKLGQNHPDYGMSVYNLAVLHEDMQNYTDVAELYKEALRVYQQSNNTQSEIYATIIRRLANFAKEAGDLKSAEALCKQSIEITKKIYGEEHIDYAASLNALAIVYWLENNYAAAELLYKQALSIYEKQNKQAHPDYSLTLNNLATLYLTEHKNELATSLLLKSVTVNKQLLIDKLNFLSESELLAYIKDDEKNLLFPLSAAYHQQSDSLLKIIYNTRLLLTGITIQNTNSLIKQAENTNDITLKTLWQGYISNKALLSKTVSLSSSTLNVDSLTTITNNQEKDLLRRSAVFRNMKEQLNTGWQNVRNSLKPGEAAIEFIRFPYWNNKWTDSVFYAALLIRPQDNVPVLIQLTEEQQLKSLLVQYANGASLKSNGATQADDISTKINNHLYQLVWQPLEPYLKDVQTVYYTPDGLLYRLAFAALPVAKDAMLADKYHLVQLSSTRQVITNNQQNFLPASIALFGGANYDEQEGGAAASDATAFMVVHQQNRGGEVSKFMYLQGTLNEVQGIKQNMEDGKKQVLFYTGKKASESSFRQLSGKSPDIIHIATHGFSFEDAPKENKDVTSSSANNVFTVSDNPLLRCGLIMAGGNNGWQNKSKPNEDDGVLTALEIASQQFDKTKLVVLSACETGLGEIRGSEGVFGLQRAFKLAGVDYVMASLWKVNDEATAEFMNSFYANWLGGKDIQQSFWDAEQLLKQSYAPHDWAAFTLIH